MEWEVRIQDDWGNGYCASVIIRNNSAQDQDWQVTLDVVGSITSLWGAAYEEKNGHLVLEGLSWNNIVPAGGTITSVGFCAKR
ncbi:MAG: cellulose binding domain-containing protein [Deltaproteobacteria bacterium]|nr:cellulose binding domain-containing protein [Deltaproteobacteria bacterium]